VDHAIDKYGSCRILFLGAAMKRKLIAGIVGAGTISDYHIRGYLGAKVSVEAIADIDLKRARAQAQKYKIEKTFRDYKEMLIQCPHIDLVSICVPNKYHAETAIYCLNSGKNVFCEKPPSINAKEAEEMKKAAEKNKKILMFDFNNRARPEVQALMSYIRAGEIGTINSAQALWIRRCGIPGFGGWFTRKSLSGGGSAIDLIHSMDLALYFMGFPEPEWVLAQTFRDFCENPAFKGPWGIPDAKDPVMDVETSSHAFISFRTGQVLFSRSSWAEMNKREEVSVTFQGTRGGGMIRRLFARDGIDETAVDTCELYTMENGYPVNRRIIVEPDKKMGREKSVSNFVDTVLGREEPLSTPEQAVALMRIIDAIYDSSKIGRPENIK
jgi:predicted dehydrogenase